MPFTFAETEIPGVILVTPRVFGDPRGFFLETYQESSFREGGIDVRFVQANQSRSVRDVVRGLHYQVAPAAQAKLVRAVNGCIRDVAVDLRPGSVTFGCWVAFELSASNHRMLFLPEGLAHGFAVLSEYADVQYMTSAEYAPEYERGVHWDDPDLAIDWEVEEPLVSDRDRELPRLRDLARRSESRPPNCGDDTEG